MGYEGGFFLGLELGDCTDNDWPNGVYTFQFSCMCFYRPRAK